MAKNIKDLSKSLLDNLDLTAYSQVGHTHKYAGSDTVGGNATAAVKLATARAINGTNFDGTAAITTAKWGTARTLTIGNSGKSVDGSGNVNWTLTEIGAAASEHGAHGTYCTCSTAAGTAAKEVVTTDTNFKLVVGQIIVVKFTASNSASNVTLNVNSTGAKSIWYNNAAYTSNSTDVCGYANRICTYMYDGTYWVWLSKGTDNNTTYNAQSFGIGYGTCDTAEATTAKVATLSNYALHKGGVVAIKFTYAVPASATLNINSKGAKAIYFRNAAITANIIKAGDTVTFMYDNSYYQLLSIDRWQNDITSHTHNYAGSSSAGGAANSAVKLSSARTITIGNKGDTFDGTGNITYTLSDIGAAATSHTHNYAGSSSAGGAANSVKTNLTVKLNGGATEGTNLFTFNGSTAKTIDITPSSIGAAASSHGTHVTYSTSTPLVAGTASVGSESNVARGDHVHPAQTSVSGNAGTATKLQTARNINGTSFDGTANITTANWGTSRNISISDSDGSNTGTAVSVNGSAAVTLKLPGTIKATLKGNADTATKATQLATGRNIQIGDKTNSFNGTGNITYTLADIGAVSKTDFDNFNVGGRNYVLDSKKETSTTSTYMTRNLCDDAKNDLAGKVVTFSFDLKLTTAGGNIYCYFRSSSGSMTPTSQTIGAGTTEYKRYSITFTAPADLSSAVSAAVHITTASGTFYLKNLKVELGNRASSWCYAIEEYALVNGNIATATKLQTARTLTIGNKGKTFDGSQNVSWSLSEIGAAESSHTHNYAGSSSAGGAANSVKTNLVIKLNSGGTEGTDLFTFNGSTAKTINITPNNIGAAASSHGTHVTYSTTAPKVAGTAAVGTESTVARGDHVHAAQTSVSGNAGTATKLATARSITIGNKSNNFDGSANITYTLSDIGAAPASHGTHSIYGTCDTAAATAEKAVTISGSGFSLTAGQVIAVKFSIANTASNVKLNVNSTGAKPIWYNTAEYTSNSKDITGNANRVITYMYNGTHWVWISGGVDNNSTYSTQGLGFGYGTCETAEATAAKVVTLASYSLTKNGIVSVKFSYAVPASATMNINSKGAKAIYFRNAAITANIIKAGDTATFIYDGSYYQLIAIDRWQNDITNHTHNYAGSSSAGGSANSAVKWTTARTLTIGDKGKTVDGSGNVSWSLAEIGAFPVAGGTATGDITVSKSGARIKATNGTNTVWFGINGGGDKWGIYDETNTKYILESNGTTHIFNGNATGTASKLATARTIQIGNKSNTFDGSANITYTLADIGAATSGHTHNYAGSSSAGGAANSAVKLSSARTINGTNFDGSANITTANWGTARKINQISVNGSADVKLPLDYYTCNVGSSNAKPYHHILATGQCTGDYTDKSITIVLVNHYNGAGLGIAKATLRTNQASAGNGATGELRWLVRSGFAENQLCYNIRTTAKDTYMDVFYKSNGTYASLTWYVLTEGARGNHGSQWTKYTTHHDNGTNVYDETGMKAIRTYTSTLQSATDHGSVNSAKTAAACSGNAATATKLATARTLTIGNSGKTFDGSENQSWSLAEIGALPTAGGTLSGDVTISTDSKLEWNRNTDYARISFKNTGDNDSDSYMYFLTGDNGNEYFKFSSISGSTTTDLLTIKTDHLRYKGNAVYHAGNKPTPADIGAAAASHGSHTALSTVTPKVAGTAAVGSDSGAARGDHVHPAQTSVSGNAGTATKLQTGRTITIGNKANTFDGSANISYSLSDIGAAASSHTHNQINSRGNVTCETGANVRPAVSGLSMAQVYSNGYPTSYGNVLSMRGAGDGQLLIGWSGTSGAHAPVYVRSRRDTTDADWSQWAQVYTTANKPTAADLGLGDLSKTVTAVNSNLSNVTITNYDTIMSSINTNIGKL